MYLISVVIPIYNTESFLSQCIESVLNQSCKEDIEIILVDDESPDNAAAICDRYGALYSNIKVVHKKNQGLGMARNSGIELATGKYIAFLDSDDYVAENYYKELLDCIRDNEADICYSIGFIATNQNKETIITMEHLRGIKFSSNSDCNNAMPRIISRDCVRNDNLIGSSCFGLYSLCFLNQYNIRFKSEREYLSEDIWFNLDCFCHASRVNYCDAIGYYYRYNTNSLVRGYKENRINQLIDFSNALLSRPHDSDSSYFERVCVYFWLNFEKCINQEVRYNQSTANRLKEMCELPFVKNVFNTFRKKKYPEKMHRVLFLLLFYGKYKTAKLFLQIYNAIYH